MPDLSLIWVAVIGFSIIMYVLLDGFDLGIGILFLLNRNTLDRQVMLNSIAPIWDGNETWLVLGGTGLFAAFPKAYALLLPVLYLPIIFLLIGLVLRGIAFEFRFKAHARQYLWDWTFALGSLLATCMQGFILGNFVRGFPHLTYLQAGNSMYLDLNVFNFITMLGLVCGYALLGATWLIIKTETKLQIWCRKIATRLAAAVMIFIVLVSILTPWQIPQVAERWFTWPNLIYLSPIPLYTGALCLTLFWSLLKRNTYLPFLSSIGLFLLSFIGLGVGIWPYIIPRIMTIWEAASPPESQLFMLTGVLLLLPLILIYTVHACWVFRGKVSGTGL